MFFIRLVSILIWIPRGPNVQHGPKACRLGLYPTFRMGLNVSPRSLLAISSTTEHNSIHTVQLLLLALVLFWSSGLGTTSLLVACSEDRVSAASGSASPQELVLRRVRRKLLLQMSAILMARRNGALGADSIPILYEVKCEVLCLNSHMVGSMTIFSYWPLISFLSRNSYRIACLQGR